jgi:hypothetical protein
MERDDLRNDVEDEQMLALFRSAEAPAPPRHFSARTMRAVIRAPLPPGRKPLRDPLISMFGWAAVIAAVALSLIAISLTQPIVAASFSRLIRHGVSTGVWLIQLGETASRVLAVLATVGVAMSRAAATAEGTIGLLLTAAVGALSLSTLRRLLISEGEDSQWQELS